MNPALQAQVKEPNVSVHVALMLQGWKKSHSLISEDVTEENHITSRNWTTMVNQARTQQKCSTNHTGAQSEMDNVQCGMSK